jgi:hypothetical protein
MNKLLLLGVRKCLFPWLGNFLSDRKQRVKVGKSISEWVSVHAGVFQGTKLGPILFLVMINDLAPPNSNYWSFVDDGTISENVPKSGTSDIQSDLNYISLWASENYMKLNPKKCKEMRVCFLREVPDVDPLTIADTPLDIE